MVSETMMRRYSLKRKIAVHVFKIYRVYLICSLCLLGHFMGKKSVAESSFWESSHTVSPQHYRKDMHTLLIQILKPQWKQAVEM